LILIGLSCVVLCSVFDISLIFYTLPQSFEKMSDYIQTYLYKRLLVEEAISELVADIDIVYGGFVALAVMTIAHTWLDNTLLVFSVGAMLVGGFDGTCQDWVRLFGHDLRLMIQTGLWGHAMSSQLALTAQDALIGQYDVFHAMRSQIIGDFYLPQ
jgi:hypothetical protein